MPARRRRVCASPRALWGLVSALLLAPPAAADETYVAVAANFSDAARDIARTFEQATGHRAVLSFGSTGQLFAQITQDAPFQVFLAADQERPAKLVERGLAAPGAPFTYAVGKLVLYSRDRALVTGADTLRAGAFAKLALANPATAPYGAAAVEVLRALGLHAQLESRLVQGGNIAQTYQFVYTGSAELGFVALSQIHGEIGGSRWLVPAALYRPIRQDAVLLAKGADDEAARAFVAFLRQTDARAIIERYGYGLAE